MKKVINCKTNQALLNQSLMINENIMCPKFNIIRETERERPLSFGISTPRAEEALANILHEI